MSGYSLLDGVRVLEVAQLAPSSVGGHLADLGAEVIKIESEPLGDGARLAGFYAIGGSDGPGFLHLRWNRGKKSVVLDLRSDDDRDRFARLARTCDAVIEGTRAGYLDRLGLGYDELRKTNPALVFCTVSGTGTDGPYRALATGGLWFDSYSGVRPVNADQPSPPGVMGGSDATPVGMYAVGAYGAMGVLAGLLRARSTGVGSHLEIASCDVAASWVPDKTDLELNRAAVFRRPDGWTPDGRLADWVRMEPYRTSDGDVMLLGAHTEKFWQRFCLAVDRADLMDIDVTTVDDGHAERSNKLWSELSDVFKQRTKAEWVEFFLAHDIAGGPVNTPSQLLADPHWKARHNTFECPLSEDLVVTLVASPVRVVGEQFAPTPAPTLGAHTDEVLGWLSQTAEGGPAFP
ncbi:CaiB/BaiF CoA transferase family protein [Mycolicibacterium sp. ELW1]|uniref:CaiB/BaiF CoA transferase family protein n=1 Tax=Mycobacteriaceae TaxID=1762 RepID=UPI0011EEB2A7|nr:CoA transferase [Mycobacterium sp. ELW1]QEN12964.1 CoA transferase [Mycobacterium sp. ELW1]